MITRETDYALRTVLCLAKSNDSGEVVSTLTLAENMSIPYRFLRKIVSKLVNAGLLESRRGKGGGLVLSRPPASMSLLDIIQAIDPLSVLLNRCCEGGEGCDREPLCGLHQILTQLQQELNDKLANLSLESVAKKDKSVC
jgi:Rrf2 family protein